MDNYLTSTDLELAEAKRLSPLALASINSRGRYGDAVSTPIGVEYLRTAFQLDRDRILHSRAFRRLKGKTQVVSPLSGEDHVRDRLTHSLEVSQLSRSMARNLGLNEDVAEAISLAHDLGHPPFGHAGEVALAEVLAKHGRSFEHNLQSKRIVTVLEPLNLSLEIIEGLDKHQTPYDQVGQKFIGSSLEAQLVNLADEIAYLRHDLEDGIRLGFLDFAKIKKDLAIFNINKLEDLSSFVKFLLTDLLSNTVGAIKKFNLRTLEDIYAFTGGQFVDFSESVRIQVNELRKLLYQQFYLAEPILLISQRGQNLTKVLFEYLLANPNHLPEIFSAKNDDILMLITDYIAGMTDRYLLDICTRFGINLD